MIIKVAHNLTEFFIENKIIKEEEKEIYHYSFELLLSSILNFLSILVLAVLGNHLVETLIFVLVFFTLRTQAGGYHARTHWRCYLLTMINYLVFVILLNVIPLEIVWLISLSFEIISVIAIYALAPIADENKPLDDGEYMRYKSKSRILIMIYLILLLTCYLLQYKNSNYIALTISIGSLLSVNSLFIAWLKAILKRTKQ